MATIKRKTRKKLSKQLRKLVTRHGPETALALVTGIVTNLAADTAKKKSGKQKAAPATADAATRKRALPRPSH
jgi:hypothetical protein